ncbi:MAG: acyl-CoA/acyl-ACP dehydrogenase [Deltaproteobacteria bacterium]|nr:acyl-CoA/acyl-ACP dehydrogenase [Deltaproteobacteria bacterium]
MGYFDLSLSLTKGDRALKEAVHKFAKEVMRPIAAKLDSMSVEEAFAPSSPYFDFLKQAYELGYHKLPFPEALGGVDLTPLQINLIMEELAWGSFGLALSLNTSLDAAAAVAGGDKMIQEFTLPYCQCLDASYIGCWAITEPDHGSDTLVAGYPSFRDPTIPAQCRAKLVGDEYVIQGQKAAWVSNGPLANSILLMCQIDAGKGHAGSGMFVFSLDRPGVSKGKPVDMIGARDLCQGEIFFDEVRVPKEYLLVGPEGYENALAAHLSLTLPMVGTWAVGLARAAFEEALSYARDRVQGGVPLVEHNNIKVKLFDMFRKIEASRALCRAAFVHNWSYPMNPEKRVLEYAMAAKTFATQSCLEVTSDAIQIFGGNGLTKEYPVEKFFRDARTTLICDGSNDTIAVAGGHKVAHTYPRM